MNAQQIRNEYLKFFEERVHAIISRTQLISFNDPTTLFTGSGMQPLLPFFWAKRTQVACAWLTAKLSPL